MVWLQGLRHVQASWGPSHIWQRPGELQRTVRTLSEKSQKEGNEILKNCPAHPSNAITPRLALTHLKESPSDRV